MSRPFAPAVVVGSRVSDPARADGGGGGGHVTPGGSGGGFATAGGSAGALIPASGQPSRWRLPRRCVPGHEWNDSQTWRRWWWCRATGFADRDHRQGRRLHRQVGGGGGLSNAGGGSGGTVVIEAPLVHFDGATSGLAANGGAGGACDATGMDGTTTLAPALAPECMGPALIGGGNGGTSVALPGPGHLACGVIFWVGDEGFLQVVVGAVGSARIATKDGGFRTSPRLS